MSDKALTRAELELTQKIQIHFPRGLPSSVLGAWNSCPATVLTECLTKEFAKGPHVYPIDEEVFELTIDGDAPENNPTKMVRRDGYFSPEDWRFIGKCVAGLQTHRFKLVPVGYCRNLYSVREKLLNHGEVPEGQWRNAFKAAYPTPNGNSCIGVADPSWIGPRGRVAFPFIDTNGDLRFDGAYYARSESWLWLIRVSK